MSIAAVDWPTALRRVADARRILLLGATDMGKSRFVREALDTIAKPVPGLLVVDLDPGQKMIGAPGTIGVGSAEGETGLQRFRFIGSTSASALRPLLAAARELAEWAGKRAAFIANTSGFVRGLGARLQTLTIEAVRPDLIVAIEQRDELAPILGGVATVPVIRLERPLLARRKSAGERRLIRQAALDQALAGAERLMLPLASAFIPARPLVFEGPARPLCALIDGAGEHMRIGILDAVFAEGPMVLAPPPPRPPAAVMLGRIWAEPTPEGWRLLEPLAPSWRQAEGG